MDIGLDGPAADAADAQQAAAGDAASFERIYHRHSARIYSLALRMLGSEEEAADAAQEVFVRTWQKLGLFRGESAFGTWLHRLAVNVILARRSGLKTRDSRFGGSVEDGEYAVRSRQTPELRVDLDNAVKTLPNGAREVFVLHDVEGYKHEEIAGMLGLSVGTSKSQLHRARMALRKQLER